MTTDPIPEGGADFRALCAELMKLNEEQPDEYCVSNDRAGWKLKWHAAIDALRAALSQPAPEPPTDEELDKLMDSILWKGSPNHWGLKVARAVLARWGQGNG